jgi:hypothetical protein
MKALVVCGWFVSAQVVHLGWFFLSSVGSHDVTYWRTRDGEEELASILFDGHGVDSLVECPVASFVGVGPP